MADRTGIAWTDATWNPIRGCSRESEGCRFCYAEKVAARFSGPGQPYEGLAERGRSGSAWTGRVEVMWHKLTEPLSWTKPRRIFVNSMSDLFHEKLPPEHIATIYAVMVAAHHLRGHTLQVLTKRAARMRALLTDEGWWHQVNVEADALVMDGTDPLSRRSDDARATLDEYGPDYPPPGIWLGVSVENQPAADERIPHLLATPAAVRFLSCEPLIAKVDLSRWTTDPANYLDYCDAVGGPQPTGVRMIDWAIVGGESGPSARPMRREWAESLIRQCRAAGVPAFFKQIGSNRGDDWPPGVTGKGDDPAQWPDEMRVQEFPT